MAEFLREEVVVLLAGQFITLFNQTALEVRRVWQQAHGHTLKLTRASLNVYCTAKQLFQQCEFPPFQTMVTPLTQKYFGYGELENSIMYCLCGVEVIAGFLFVRWLSSRVAERVVLAIGLIICNISGVWCLIFLAKPLGLSPFPLA